MIYITKKQQLHLIIFSNLRIFSKLNKYLISLIKLIFYLFNFKNIIRIRDLNNIFPCYMK